MTRVFCLGDLMVDVLARLPGPLAVGTDTPAPITVLGGGSAANTAAWLAATGVPVTFVGRVGDDPAGRSQRGVLASHGLDLAVSVDPRLATGTCIVLVDASGERTMVPDAGANAALCPADVPVGSFAPGDHLHVSGYALFGGSRDAARYALAAARAGSLTVSVGAASAGPLRAVGAETFLDWIGADLLLFANCDEAVALTGQREPVAAVRALAARVGRAIVTCGPDGAVWSGGGEPVRCPAPVVDVVDSTGAGDAFAAGALAAVISGRPITAALSQGHVLSAQACRTVGARPAP